MTNAMEKKLDIWKKKLLDMGMRNRLLNFKDSKRGSMTLISPDCASLYKQMVLDEKTLRFPHIEMQTLTAENFYDADSDETTPETAPVEIAGDIQTNRSVKETHQIAKNLRDKAKIATEEQGVNVLYLAFGFVEWKENERSSTFIQSPLVLVPVVLSIDSITDPYKLSLHEDEVVVNPTLSYKLENDFGLILPAFDAQNDDLMQYFKKVEAEICKFGWRVSTKVSLALLSFLKINMYKDLERRAGMIGANKIIKALAGDSDAGLLAVSGMESYDHDKEDLPVHTFQVVDADSSQQDAIIMSKKGVSFVLQGPPGTGKSQTITNIIAEALADGKKVLFVSEKMAALEVVHKRLAAAGLSDFCLVLHSNKANKREFLDSLRHVLELHPISVKDSALYKLKMLEDRRLQLNRYCEELHRVIQPIGQSVFDANGIIAQLQFAPNFIFTIDGIDIRQLTKEELFELTGAVSSFAKTKANLAEGYEENTWRHCVLSKVNHELRHDLSSGLKTILVSLKGFLENWYVYQEDLGLNLELTYSMLPDFAEMLTFCGTAKPFPESWLVDQNIALLVEQANVLRQRKERQSELKKDLLTNFDESILELPVEKCKQQIDAALSKVQTVLSKDYSGKERILDHLSTLIAVSKDAAQCFEEANHIISRITGELSIKKEITSNHISAFADFLNAFSTDIRPDQSWFSAISVAAANRQKSVQTAKNLIAQIQDTRSELLGTYEKEILDIDYAPILSRFKTEYTSFFRFLKGTYRADCNMVRMHCRIPQKKISFDEMVHVLETIKKYQGLQAALLEQETTFRRDIGGWYIGEDTDFAAADAGFQAMEKIVSWYNDGLPKIIQSVLLEGNNVSKYAPEAERLMALANQSCIPTYLTYQKECSCRNNIQQTAESAKMLSDILIECQNQLNAIPTNSSANIDELIRYHALEKVIELQTLQSLDAAQEEELAHSFDSAFHGFDTDWNQTLELLQWVSKFREYIEQYNLPFQYQRGIAAEKRFAVVSSALAEEIQAFCAENDKQIKWFDALFSEEENLLDYPVQRIKVKAQKCIDNLKGLEEWIDFCHAKKKCEDVGLTKFVEEILNSDVDCADIEAIFTKRFERLWLDSVIPELPAVEAFRGRKQEDLIDEFRRLDQEQLKIAQSRIREKLINGLPNVNSFTSSKDEVGILMREIGKQRKIMPVRKMFDRIPNLLPSLKPCLMMSPLSVSQFLQSENYSFDMVIFDEASQVKTENAVGAISRGDQVIIAGDIHQLPPTNFFTATVSDTEYDSESGDDSEAFESVLDESTTILPQLTLKWHYRSRNESLIAFSNAKIYNNSLITFPSPTENADSEGVEYIYVSDGIYDRSGRRNNPTEAKKVADVIFEQLQKYPERSIGVITFSEAQQRCVEAEIIARRLANPAFEEFFNEDKEEAFFIKNLENVQGDERDTIIFSIGYGKSNPMEELRMNFGPLNQSGGYRRLNVAVTRAKYAIKLVGSILPTDMRITDETPKGVKLLRDYIEFAQNGVKALQNELTYTDVVRTESPFEDSVYDFLTRHGYNLATQVGCSGYRIDMAVKHPTLQGRFVIGIECDGASYHSSRTARERDRLRQAVLESMGWKFYRIWSTDWIKDPVTEGEHLLEAVEYAMKHYSEQSSLMKQKVTTLSVPADEIYTNVKDPVKAPTENTFGFEIYQEKTLPKSLNAAPIPKIAQAVAAIVKTQAPIHKQLVCKQVAPLYGNAKVTKKVSDGVDFIIDAYAKSYHWELRNDYLWKEGQKKAVPKVPRNGEKGRPIQQVCPEELAEAMFVITDTSFGIDKNSLFKVVTREYGFVRTTAAITNHLELAYAILVNSGRIKEIEGKLSVG